MDLLHFYPDRASTPKSREMQFKKREAREHGRTPSSGKKQRLQCVHNYASAGSARAYERKSWCLETEGDLG